MVRIQGSMSRHARARPIGLGAGGALLLALLVAIPNVATAGVSHSISKVPPFHGSHHYASIVQSTGCGGSATLVVPPTFNLTTGVGREYGKSAATGCGPPTFSDTGFTGATMGYDSVPFVVHSPAPKNFSLSFSSNISWNLSATPMNPVGGPFAWASAAIVWVGELYDLTNASVRWTITSVYLALPTNSTTTGNVTGGAVGTGGGSVTNDAGLTVVGHHYIFQFFVEISEWTYAPSGTTTHASARLNAGTGGHEVHLLSWTVS
jgi:hypothetical protein